MKRNRKNAAIKRKIVKAIGEPWDWEYMLDLEKAKLETMLKYFKESQIVEDWSIIVRDIKLAIKLIDIITNEGVINEEYSAIDCIKYSDKVNFRNLHRFLPKVTYNENYKLFYSYVRLEKAWHLYHKLRVYRMRSWWD